METYFEFLDDLRESGDINMFGAPRVLMDVFNMSKVEAMNVFIAWTEQFQFGKE
jgi:hypothetical protein